MKYKKQNNMFFVNDRTGTMKSTWKHLTMGYFKNVGSEAYATLAIMLVQQCFF